MNRSLGIYIHIPFCEKKCNYCDFYSIVNKNLYEEQYIESLEKEIDLYKNDCNGYIVDSIFIGGGTPSYLNPENIGRILKKIKNVFNVENSCEITIEVNPNSVDPFKIEKYKNYGINRVSIGIQSLDDDILKFIGRVHNKKQAIESVHNVKQAGIHNINVDVMFNIPGQTPESVINTLSEIIAEGVDHISFYSLKIEENTVFYKMEKQGHLLLADDEEEREVYYAGRDFMEKNNYIQYEISNFSLKNKECKHNIRYWSCGEYIGFGPFAHSYFCGKRYGNVSDIDVYCNDSSNFSKYRIIEETLSKEDMMFEFIMLGLRMKKGISLNCFNETFGIEFREKYRKVCNKLMEEELLVIKGDNLMLTKKGIDISNYVFLEFMK